MYKTYIQQWTYKNNLLRTIYQKEKGKQVNRIHFIVEMSISDFHYVSFYVMYFHSLILAAYIFSEINIAIPTFFSVSMIHDYYFVSLVLIY